jgi:large subunit ribosomal protein L13
VKTNVYKTVSANSSTVEKKWVIMDAKNQNLGRFASKVAKVIRGKYKPNFTPHVDCGDNVIVINAEKINLSGDKWEKKKYVSHTGYPGGQKIMYANEAHSNNSTFLVSNAVKGMLPKNKLGSLLNRNLRVFSGESHNLIAQKPTLINLNDLK